MGFRLKTNVDRHENAVDKRLVVYSKKDASVNQWNCLMTLH